MAGPATIRRVPAAEWIGPEVDVHELWRMAEPERGSQVDLDLHTFLRYCYLMKRIKIQFEEWNNDQFFDVCLFFLRGSFGIWSFLNTETDLQLRSTMCGGLRHDHKFIVTFQDWLRTTFANTVKNNRNTLDIFILDEVKSGTGLGHQMNTIKEVLKGWNKEPLAINIKYLAVAPPEWKRKELPLALRKWKKPTRCGRNKLCIQPECFMGPLIAYDNDRLLGIAQASIDQGYRAIRHEGGLIALSCPGKESQPTSLMLCPSGGQNIVIGAAVAAIATAKKGVVTTELRARIHHHDCPVCRALLRHLSV